MSYADGRADEDQLRRKIWIAARDTECDEAAEGLPQQDRPLDAERLTKAGTSSIQVLRFQ